MFGLQKRNQNRKTSAELEQWSIGNILKLTFYAIVLPPFRLFRLAVQLHPTQHPSFSWGHLFFDLFSTLFVLVVIGLFHYWPGVLGLVGFLFVAIFLGIARRIRAAENAKIHYDMDTIGKLNYIDNEELAPEKREAPRVKFTVAEPKNETQKSEPKMKTSTKNSLPDFDENDYENWRKWISENPTMIRAQRR